MMGHARSPLRLGLAGGGTDVAPYSDTYGGQVLNATISLYTHCHVRRVDGAITEFYAADFDERAVVPLSEWELPQEPLRLHRAVYTRIVRQFLGGAAPALHVVTYSDVPSGSGVGSSSALVVAMISAYCQIFRIPLGEYDIAHLAYEIERIDCGLAGGKQDQYAASFGGFNFMEFGPRDRVVINPLRVKRELVNDLESQLLLYYTGRSRDSARIIEEQIAATRSPHNQALEAMHQMRRSALEMKEALLRGNNQRVLDILGESWEAKKRAASAISNSAVEAIAERAMAAGARALKISGAGGGGFMMIAVDASRRYEVIRALEGSSGHFVAFSFVDTGVESWTCA